jgi:hypothetical protein
MLVRSSTTVRTGWIFQREKMNRLTAKVKKDLSSGCVFQAWKRPV